MERSDGKGRSSDRGEGTPDHEMRPPSAAPGGGLTRPASGESGTPRRKAHLGDPVLIGGRAGADIVTSVGARRHAEFRRPRLAALGRFMERSVIERGKRTLLTIPHLDDGRNSTENDDSEHADEPPLADGPAADVVEMIREYRNIIRRGRDGHPLTDSFCYTVP